MDENEKQIKNIDALLARELVFEVGIVFVPEWTYWFYNMRDLMDHFKKPRCVILASFLFTIDGVEAVAFDQYHFYLKVTKPSIAEDVRREIMLEVYPRYISAMDKMEADIEIAQLKYLYRNVKER